MRASNGGRSKHLVAGHLAEPSIGLEPMTPSLPWKVPAQIRLCPLAGQAADIPMLVPNLADSR